MTPKILPAATVTVALDDEIIDSLCFAYAFATLRDRRLAGKLFGYVEATLAANPGLARLGTILPRGTVVHLPEFAIAPAPQATFRLWD